MIDELTFRLTLEDGSTVDETVSLDFSDLSASTFASIVRDADLNDPFDVTARVLQQKLSVEVSLDLLRPFLEGLSEGKGVTLGQ